MKKYLFIALVIVFLFTLTGCGEDASQNSELEGQHAPECQDTMLNWVRQCGGAGCINPKTVAIYQNTCSKEKFYKDRYGYKHNYYGNGSIDWSIVS